MTVRQVFTEPRTDMIIEEVIRRVPLPWWSRRIIKGFLDKLFPEVIINAVDAALDRERDPDES